jgi:hypothetical protein
MTVVRVVRHGTRSTYRKGCRCQWCTTAASGCTARYVALNRAAGLAPDDPRHGTLYGYVTFACRCPLCTGARHVYDQQRRGTR